MVEVFEPHAHGRLVLPAAPAVVAIEEQARVLLLRHHRGRRADALERLRVEHERRVLPGRRCLEDDHLPAVADIHAVHLDARGRLEATEHRRDVAERDVGDLLANEPAVKATPISTLPPSPFRKAQSVSPARFSSSVSDSPWATSDWTAARVVTADRTPRRGERVHHRDSEFVRA